MKLEAIGKPFTYKWPGGEVHLEPGKPIDLPPDRAAKLLARAGDRVRQVDPEEPVVIEPACRPDGSPVSPVYFERGDGVIYGPARVTDFAKTRSGEKEQFWVIVEFEGQAAWIISDRLRSKKQFETQKPVREVELIREAKL